MREIINEFSNLENLLTDRISDLHDVKMGQVERHAFILYRNMLWEIKKLVADEFKKLKCNTDILSSELESLKSTKNV